MPANLSNLTNILHSDNRQAEFEQAKVKTIWATVVNLYRKTLKVAVVENVFD